MLTGYIIALATGALLAWFARQWIAAPEGWQDSGGFHFGPEPLPEHPAQVSPDPTIRARDTGRRGGFPPVAPSAALSTPVHDAGVAE